MSNFTMTLKQEGARVSGLMAETPTPNASPLSGTVSGVVTARRLKLIGSLSWKSDSFPDVFGFADLQEFDALVEPDGHITGTFVLRDLRPDGSEFLRRECEILQLDRISP